MWISDSDGAQHCSYDVRQMLATWPTRTHAATGLSDAVARRIAAGVPPAARIHSVYRSVVNVSIPDGLLCLAAPWLGGLPNGILVDLGPDFRALGLRRGMGVVATDMSVGVPAIGLEIDLMAAARWSARLACPDGGLSRAADRWRGRRGVAWAEARARAVPGGLGALLGAGSPSADDPGVVRRAGASVDALRASLLAGNRPAAHRAARGLIGLGPGLTPSGDDVLVGVEAALRALDGPLAGFVGGAIHDVDDRTTVIAATLLRHAAAGEFAERIQALLAALLGHADEAVPAAIQRAIAWGATSGTDCLLGVLLGLDVASEPGRWAG